MTDVLMYDGVNSLAAGIARQFPDAAKVAGYANGTYAWSQAEWGLFPHADHVTISVRASANEGDVLDCEPGDAGPAQVKAWIEMRRAAGLYRPTVYCSRSVIPAVRAATGSLLLGKDYDVWVADYTGSPHQVTAPGPGTPWQCVATQYESTANWDASVVYDLKWPHRKPPGLAAPIGLSGTPHVTGNLSWAPVPGAVKYEVQVTEGTLAAPGRMIVDQAVSGTHAMGISLPEEPCCWRVRALPSGAWSPWKVLER